jgi:arabinogalactan endo-1,4-beta-galactosidase
MKGKGGAMESKGRLAVFAVLACVATMVGAQQPREPVDVHPIDGEVYYLINQHSGLQADSLASSGSARVTQETWNFRGSSQRWMLARAADGSWAIENVGAQKCLADELQRAELIDCGVSIHNRWQLIPSTNGYYAVRNRDTHRLLDVTEEVAAPAAALVTSPEYERLPQSQLWLLRPAVFRGMDNALLEKQEALRVSQNTPWWKDAGLSQDVLSIFRNHGINMIRLRPSSAPPYVDPSVTGCQGNACFAETESQDLDLARRAKNLGMSIELTLLFDGGNSQSVPPAWAADTLQQAQADLYAYVKAEVERYRNAGVMPDLISIGNEVDTGFLGALGSPTGAQFGNFAALQISGMQAVSDASSDPALGLPLPRPLTCIHITPAWDLTSFFTLVKQNGIPYDVICQSYYPFFHGPLTDAQASMANPFAKPVEQDVLMNAVAQIGKPIFLIETGEHYENGFDANDPWYSPSVPNQRQFLLDLQGVMNGLPDNSGMGIEYWDGAGVNILADGGPFYFNGGFPPDSIYVWNGLTLFNNADSSGSSNQEDPGYSNLLSGIDALGGKLDQARKYKLVTSSGTILSLSGRHVVFELDSVATTSRAQWIIRSSGDGFFQVSSAQVMDPPLVLDGSNVDNTVVASPDNSPAQQWDVRSLGNGVFQLVNRASGQPVSIRGRELSFHITPTL